MRGSADADARYVSVFGLVTLVGVGICLSTLLRAFISWGENPKRPSWSDPTNVGGHWRGWLQVGAATTGIGLVGLLFVALVGGSAPELPLGMRHSEHCASVSGISFRSCFGSSSRQSRLSLPSWCAGHWATRRRFGLCPRASQSVRCAAAGPIWTSSRFWASPSTPPHRSQVAGWPSAPDAARVLGV
jgi:hypothetical protein